MNYLKAEIVLEKYDTASKPLKVCAENGKYYICKYANFGIPAENLAKEYIATHLLENFSINTPKFEIVTIDFELVRQEFQDDFTKRKHFDSPTFGSEYIQYAKTIEQLNYPFKNLKCNYNNDLLVISFFDLWVGNEDRSQDNYNLLIDSDDDSEILFAIDHEHIFNRNFLYKDLEILPESYNIVGSDLIKSFYHNKKSKDSIADSIIDTCNNSIQICKSSLGSILNEIPKEWEIEFESTINLMELKLFSNDWIDKVNKYFKTYFTKV